MSGRWTCYFVYCVCFLFEVSHNTHAVTSLRFYPTKYAVRYRRVVNFVSTVFIIIVFTDTEPGRTFESVNTRWQIYAIKPLRRRPVRRRRRRTHTHTHRCDTIIIVRYLQYNSRTEVRGRNSWLASQTRGGGPIVFARTLSASRETHGPK